ncbi:ABC transporter ATP-binding protein [Arenibaculum pallidiluteum]|uniref:ABC transporter ATP-binding protein n=1 Tax=Arenibaculum pallidiluteum TaxID=2812559 RepID=UPI001A975642|nr:ABC transporter ATP-binding protein [Arenibaculum pallidiluteum]
MGPFDASYRDLGRPLPRRAPAFVALMVLRFLPGQAALMAFAAAGAIGLMGLEPVFLRRLVDALGAAQGGAGGDAAGAGWTAGILLWLMAVGGAWMGSALFNRLQDWAEGQAGPALRRLVQSVLFSYVMEHAPLYFQENLAGRLAQRVKQAGDAAVVILGIVLFEVVRTVTILAMSVAILAGENGIFLGVILIWTVAFLGTAVLWAPRCLRLSAEASSAVSAVGGQLVDVISNASLVRSFGRIAHERRMLSETLGEEMAAARRLRAYLIRMRLVQYSATILFQLALAGLAVSEALAGRMGVGEFVMVVSLANILALNVWILSQRVLDFVEQTDVLGEGLRLVAAPHAIVDRPGAPALAATRGRVEFQGVRFAHAGGPAVLGSLDLVIRGGEKVALVGSSGAGKSTLVRLLRRDFDPDAGRILIDGQDIAAVTQASLRAALAEVPQDPALLHRSLRENLRYARPDAGDAAILQAVRLARCDALLARRPEGLDAVVGERGLLLSGGERQRVAIARALLKDAPILILDEATSSLDSEIEALVQDALWRLFEGRTVIAIAHRLTTMARMDRILVLDAGRILEEGSHDELLARGGAYARLWLRQAGAGGAAVGAPDPSFRLADKV